jgi:hypothetical protein
LIGCRSPKASFRLSRAGYLAAFARCEAVPYAGAGASFAIINRKSKIDNSFSSTVFIFSGVEIRLSQEFSSSCPTRHPG